MRNFLDRTFNQRWLGRRESATEFPPQSPDLTPLDFYLWGTINNTVYATKSQTLEELRDQNEHAINDIPFATIQTECPSVRRNCVVGSVLWQAVDILNMFVLKDF